MNVDILERLAAGSPIIVVVLLFAVIALWKEIKIERKDRIDVLNKSLADKEQSIKDMIQFRQAIEMLTHAIQKE